MYSSTSSRFNFRDEGQHSSAAVVPHLHDIAVRIVEVRRGFGRPPGSESTGSTIFGLLTVFGQSSSGAPHTRHRPWTGTRGSPGCHQPRLYRR